MRDDYPSLIEIKKLYGMEELKFFADRLVITAQNAKARSIQYPPLPNLILASGPGYGVTSHIGLISGLIRETRLMRFSGEEEYFEMYIPDLLEYFELLLKRIKIAAGFYGEFRGVIGLDVTPLFDNDVDFSVMERLMDFVDLHQGKILFVFIVPPDAEQQKLSAFLYQFTNRTPVEFLHLRFPDTADNIAFIRERLLLQKITLSDEAITSLTSIVEELRKDRKFKGYDTLRTLIDELIWYKLSSPSGSEGAITAEDLDFLSSEEKLLGVIRMKNKKKKSAERHIGFFLEGADNDDDLV